MGLLSHIQNLKGHNTGLLARAESLALSQKEKSSENDFLPFADFAEKKGFAVCGIFSQAEDFFYLKKSHNLDLVCIADSVSTKDFWDGLIQDESSWILFEGDRLTSLYQLFSEKIKNEIKSLAVFPFTAENTQNYFFVINPAGSIKESGTEELKTELTKTLSDTTSAQKVKKINLEAGFAISPAHLFIISAKLSLESIFSGVPENLKDSVKKSAMEIIYSRSQRLFSEPNACICGRDEEIKCVIFAREEIDEKLLQHQINVSTQDLFCNEQTSNLLVLYAGGCQNKKGAQAFLLQD